MKKLSLLIVSAVAFLTFFASCDKKDSEENRTANFETLTFGIEGYWNGSAGTNSFISADLTFDNIYNTQYFSWSGFANSHNNDFVTLGYDNEYSVYDAANKNNKFAIFYLPYSTEAYASFPQENEYLVRSISLCNSTLVALTLKNGDNFSKKFGGATGNDKDWFKVTIVGFDAANLLVGKKEFYLADFRPDDNSKDYIVNKWTEVDLSSLGKINKLTFEFDSSDKGQYGLNTPTYVCLDNIKYVYTEDGL